MSIKSVRNYFIERGLEDPVFEMDHLTATVEQAASTIGVEPKLIAKTLAFRLKEKDILIVVRGDAKINNKKYKETFKTKAKMLNLNEVEEITGHPVGGVCPFGLNNPLDIYLDVSLKEFEYVYPAAGAVNAALKITPEDMKDITKGEWVDVCQY